MFDSPATIIFRILNFVVLIAVCVYLFKRYAYPTLKADQQAQEARKKALEQEREALAILQANFDEQIKAQEQERSELQKKLEVWQHAFAHQTFMLAAERAQRQEQIANLIKQRIQFMQDLAWRSSVVPAAVAQAREQLQHVFASQEKGTEYLDAIVKSWRCNE